MPSAHTHQPIWNKDRRLWPKAARDYVFLADAFHEVGRELFGDEWTGREALPPEYPVLQSVQEATTQRVSGAPPPIRPLDSTRPALSMTDATGRRFTMEEIRAGKIRTAEDAEAARRRWQEYCEGKWAEAKPELEAEQTAATQAIARRDEVATWIAQKVRDGDLVSYGYCTGLPLWELPPAIWNQSDDWDLFAECAVGTYAPTVANIPCIAYLFLMRNSLKRALSAGAGKASAEAKAEKWLRSRAEPTKGKGLSRTELEAEAIGSIPGLSKRAFGRAWERVANDFPEMRMPGPRPTVG